SKTVPRAQPAHTARRDLRLTIELASFLNDCHHNRHCPFVSKLLTLTHSLTVDLLETTLVDEGATDLTFVDHRRTFAVEFEHVAILDQNDVLFFVAEMVFDKLLMPKQHSILTVNRN